MQLLSRCWWSKWECKQHKSKEQGYGTWMLKHCLILWISDHEQDSISWFPDDLVTKEVLQDYYYVVIGPLYFLHECDIQGGHAAAVQHPTHWTLTSWKGCSQLSRRTVLNMAQSSLSTFLIILTSWASQDASTIEKSNSNQEKLKSQNLS